MPKRAALETASVSGVAPDFRETVASADIIYFPSERAASGGRSEPAALLLEALEASGTSFAVAWDIIDANQQPMLDQLPSLPSNEREQLVARIELNGSGRAREHCRSLLNGARLAGIRQIALRLTDAVPGAADDRRVSMRFRSPADGMETFAERMTAAESLSGRDVATAYRAQVAQQQFAAEQIVRHFQSGATGKLLVFMRAADLEAGQGVPFYVAQKLPQRQLVLGPRNERNARALITAHSGHTQRRAEIVDRTEVATRD